MATVADMIIAEAQTQSVDPNLALAVAQQESGLNPNARGGSGEIGVFQLMPSTAAMLGVNPYDLSGNIHGGVMYLRLLLTEFGGNVSAALAAYNLGPGRVENAMNSGGDNWFSLIAASTQNYVKRILAWLGGSPQMAPPVPGVTSASAAQPISSRDSSGLVVAGVALGLIILLAVWG